MKLAWKWMLGKEKLLWWSNGGRSRTAATFKTKPFVMIVFKKDSILDAAAVLDPPLILFALEILLVWI